MLTVIGLTACLGNPNTGRTALFRFECDRRILSSIEAGPSPGLVAALDLGPGEGDLGIDGILRVSQDGGRQRCLVKGLGQRPGAGGSACIHIPFGAHRGLRTFRLVWGGR